MRHVAVPVVVLAALAPLERSALAERRCVVIVSAAKASLAVGF